MGKVILIKNNSTSEKIYKYAKMSYEEQKCGYYNSLNGSKTEAYVKKIRDSLDGDEALVTLITYDKKFENIIDVFVGLFVEINDNYNIEYRMKKYLNMVEHKSVIDGIVDKMDMDMNVNMPKGQFVLLCEMNCIYEELMERIKADYQNCPTWDGAIADVSNDYILSDFAQKNENATRIYKWPYKFENKSEFQIDRENIVTCKSYRRLVDKAQIFSATKGDHYRTRMTHTLEVNQIAKAIAFSLNLNIDLTEAIALAHDLGHTPFGHQGERTINDILFGKINLDIGSKELFDNHLFGGFKHNYQSAKILTSIEEKYVEFPGLNTSIQVVEGVLKHTDMRMEPDKRIELGDFLRQEYIEKIYFSDQNKQICSTLEGQVVAIADEIAQRGHDLDDALTSDVLSIDELLDRLKTVMCTTLEGRIVEKIKVIDVAQRLIVDKKELKVNAIVNCVLDYLISETINKSREQIKTWRKGCQQCVIDFSDEAKGVNTYLERIVQKKVICNNEVASADCNADVIIRTLFKKYYSNPRLLHEGTVHKIFLETLLHKNAEVRSSAVNLNDTSVKLAEEEIDLMSHKELGQKEMDMIKQYREDGIITEDNRETIIIFEKRRILVRAIVDYISGMTDEYALNEYKRLL